MRPSGSLKSANIVNSLEWHIMTHHVHSLVANHTMDTYDRLMTEIDWDDTLESVLRVTRECAHLQTRYGTRTYNRVSSGRVM
jgi:hypothetical protein